MNRKPLRGCKQGSDGLRSEFLERSLWLLYREPPREGARLATAIVLVGGDDTLWGRGEGTRVERSGLKWVDYW